MIRQAEELLEDYYSIEGIELLELKLGIQANQEQANQTYDVAVTLAAANDSIRKVEYSRQLDEVRTQYEVDRHILEKDRNYNYFLFALAGCLLLLVLLFVWMSYSRRLRKKNRNLVRRLEEQDALRARLKALEPKEPIAPTILTPGTAGAEKQLFHRFEQYVLSNNIYSNPEFNRKEIASLLGTNETYLFNAVRTTTGMSLQEYIYSLRLEKGRDFLKNFPDKTIDAIAAETGFNSSRTFYRHFRTAYGMSPAEYRKEL